MRNRYLFTCLTTLAAVSSAGAQTRPDFSGDWVRNDSAEQRSVATVGDASFRVGNMGSGWGSPLTIRQDTNRLTVEYAFFGTYDLQPKLSLSFALDGSESRNSIMLSHAESVLRSRATWRDSTLVITTTYPAPAGVSGGTEVRQVLMLQSPTSLVLETTRSGGSGASQTLRTTYTKR